MARKKKLAAEQGALFPEVGPPTPLPAETIAKVDTLVSELAQIVSSLPLAAQVELLNRARLALHEVSPFRGEPVDCVLWFRAEEVAENTWNPNAVPPPEMVALTHSVRKFGYTMPIVGTRLAVPAPPIRIRINDGKHRNVVGRHDREIRERIHGYLPLSLLKGSFTEADEMSATILHNEARGRHSVAKEVAIVRALDDAGWSSEQIGVGTVKSAEELIRIRQLGGAAQNLASDQYGKAWDF